MRSMPVFVRLFALAAVAAFAAAVAPAAAAEDANTVAFGPACSMTANAVKGYHDLGASRLWSLRDPTYKVGGATLSKWTDVTSDRNYWHGWSDNVGFDGKVDAHAQPVSVWIMPCPGKGGRNTTYDVLGETLVHLRTFAPDAALYVSAIPRYEPGHLCEILGNDLEMQEAAHQASEQVAADAVADGVAQPGPLMPELKASQTSDGCHANAEGQRLLGQAVIDFFG